MNAKLAMLACKETREGPWSRPQGCEVGIKVTGVGEGDLVFAEYELRGLLRSSSYELGEGQHPFHHPDCKRYRIRKVAQTKDVATTVEVLFE